MYGDTQCLSAPAVCLEHAVPQRGHGPRTSLVTPSLCPFWNEQSACLVLHCSTSRQSSYAMLPCVQPPSSTQFLKRGILQCWVLQGTALSASGSCRVTSFQCWVLAEHHFFWYLSNDFIAGSDTEHIPSNGSYRTLDRFPAGHTSGSASAISLPFNDMPSPALKGKWGWG